LLTVTMIQLLLFQFAMTVIVKIVMIVEIIAMIARIIGITIRDSDRDYSDYSDDVRG